MLTRRLSLLCGTVLFVAAAASAEVSVLLDTDGGLTRLDVRADNTANLIWTKLSELPDEQTLNPLGDLLQDGAPTCSIFSLPDDDPAHLTRGGRGGPRGAGDSTGNAVRRLRSAVVLWSRYDGQDFEILYSLWDPTSRAWRAPAYLERSDNAVQDVHPSVYIVSNRIYAVWQKDGVDVAAVGSPSSRSGAPDIYWTPPVRILPGSVVGGVVLGGPQKRF